MSGETRGVAVRPADPLFRREHPNAHEVVTYFGDYADLRMQRVLGVWTTEAAAIKVAKVLAREGGDQLR